MAYGLCICHFDKGVPANIHEKKMEIQDLDTDEKITI